MAELANEMCQDCGKIFKVRFGSQARYCPKCRKKRISERAKERHKGKARF